MSADCTDKFNNIKYFGTLEPMRLPDSWKGLEITHLENGGYYFAPPGDFSKVDFSACQKQEPVIEYGFTGGFWDALAEQVAKDAAAPKKDGVVLEHIGGNGGFSQWRCIVTENGQGRLSWSRDPGEALDRAGLPHLKMPSYGPVNEWPIEAASPARYMVSGGPATGFQSFARMGGEGGFLEPSTPLSSKPVTAPKTAQHSEQAKPALPSLMTEAGEKYQGLGWCDE